MKKTFIALAVLLTVATLEIPAFANPSHDGPAVIGNLSAATGNSLALVLDEAPAVTISPHALFAFLRHGHAGAGNNYLRSPFRDLSIGNTVTAVHATFNLLPRARDSDHNFTCA